MALPGFLDSIRRLPWEGIGRPKTRTRVFFSHVPKCGGTSLAEAIRRSAGFREYLRYGAFQTIDVEATKDVFTNDEDGEFVFRHRFAHYQLARRMPRFLCGHFLYDSTFEQYRRTGGWVFVTLLRDPIEHWLSSYFYNRRRTREGRRYPLVNERLADYIETPSSYAIGNHFVRWFHGQPLAADCSTDAAFERALTNIKTFDVVGRLEDLSGFVRDFERRCGGRLAIPHENRNDAERSRGREEVTPEIRERLREITAPNRRLYEAVFGKG